MGRSRWLRRKRKQKLRGPRYIGGRMPAPVKSAQATNSGIIRSVATLNSSGRIQLLQLLLNRCRLVSATPSRVQCSQPFLATGAVLTKICSSCISVLSVLVAMQRRFTVARRQSPADRTPIAPETSHNWLVFAVFGPFGCARSQVGTKRSQQSFVLAPSCHPVRP